MSTAPFSARITVRLSDGVNDPQGNTVRDGLRSLGHADVRRVRVGKIVDLVLEADDAVAARQRVEQMCQELLANPVIETYEIAIGPITAGASATGGTDA